MNTCQSPWFAGLICDHLYEDCPNRRRGERQLRLADWWSLSGPSIDPHGTDVCGLCVHRHNQTMHKETR